MEPSEKTAEIIRYGNHKAKVQMLRPEDYTITFDEMTQRYYVDTRTIHGWGVFKHREDAENHIIRRTTHRPGRAKVFTSICHCGALPWDYYSFGDITAEICNTCGNPLYLVCLEALNQQAIADVDLFDLLG